MNFWNESYINIKIIDYSSSNNLTELKINTITNINSDNMDKMNALFKSNSISQTRKKFEKLKNDQQILWNMKNYNL